MATNRAGVPAPDRAFSLYPANLPCRTFLMELEGETARTANPAQTSAFFGVKSGVSHGVVDAGFPLQYRTFLTDAPSAQLDRTLDYELFSPTPISPRHSSVFSRLGPLPSGQEVTGEDRKGHRNANPVQTEVLSRCCTKALPRPVVRELRLGRGFLA